MLGLGFSTRPRKIKEPAGATNAEHDSILPWENMCKSWKKYAKQRGRLDTVLFDASANWKVLGMEPSNWTLAFMFSWNATRILSNISQLNLWKFIQTLNLIGNLIKSTLHSNTSTEWNALNSKRNLKPLVIWVTPTLNCGVKLVTVGWKRCEWVCNVDTRLVDLRRGLLEK